MSEVNPDELAARMKRISELTEQLLAMHSENEQARQLAEHINQEIDVARRQILHYKPIQK